ncbi:MAG TPA: hypothetical protein VJP80_06450 [Candidatus Saccharimonadales bacterium]|nr:hypothetical protein [Candidatus Saccharimonadales bacterium]
MKPIISIKEARKLLGADASGMSDEEILDVIETLHSLAKGAIEDAKVSLRRKKDAKALANVIYDVYKDKKKKELE